MSEKHTPGPWKVYDDGDMWIAPSDGDAPIVCDICPHGEEFVYSLEDDANAHLIAAAPELLEALKVAQAWIADESCPCEGCEAVNDQIAAAIAKAEGR